MKITKYPETGDTLWISDSALYLPPPLRHRSHKRTYLTALLIGALVCGFGMIGPLLNYFAN